MHPSDEQARQMASGARMRRFSGLSPSPQTLTVALIAASLLIAAVIDYLDPWPYVMTPLYAVSVLIAARRLPPRGVVVTGVLATVMNLAAASDPAHHMPLSVLLLYTSGLVITVYLAVLLSLQRQQIDRQVREVEEARQRLQLFLRMVTHDLRSPLTAITGSLEMLQQSTFKLSPQQQERYLQAMESAAHRVGRLAEDLDVAARIGSGSFELRPQMVNLVEIARRVVDLQQATTMRHTLVLEAPERLVGRWDAERLSQLLANLVANAIKYSPHGGEVHVSLQSHDGEAEIRVSDQGSGLSEEQIGRLFRPFTRVYSGSDIPGAGLGLYISKAIVDAHGGQIRVESRPGQGSTFVVTLPGVTER